MDLEDKYRGVVYSFGNNMKAQGIVETRAELQPIIDQLTRDCVTLDLDRLTT